MGLENFVAQQDAVRPVESTRLNAPERRGVVLEGWTALTEDHRANDQVQFIYQAVDDEVAPEGTATPNDDLFALPLLKLGDVGVSLLPLYDASGACPGMPLALAYNPRRGSVRAEVAEADRRARIIMALMSKRSIVP